MTLVPPRTGLARLLDHSLLRPEATEEQVLAGAEMVREYSAKCGCVLYRR